MFLKTYTNGVCVASRSWPFECLLLGVDPSVKMPLSVWDPRTNVSFVCDWDKGALTSGFFLNFYFHSLTVKYEKSILEYVKGGHYAFFGGVKGSW